MTITARSIKRRGRKQRTKQRFPELEAVSRLEQKKQTGVQVPLSNNAAARALMQVSPAARRLLLGMVAVHSDLGGGSCNFGQAVKAMGGRSLSWQVLDELHAAGLMRFNHLGNHEIHPLFGSIAHRLFEFGHDADDGGRGVETGSNCALHDKGGLLALPCSSAR